MTWTQVRQGDLTQSASFDAQIVPASVENLYSDASGILTRQVAIGSVVMPGESPIAFSEQPVVMIPGAVPMFRDIIAPEAGSPAVSGDDVAQVQQFLTSSGYFSGTINGRWSDYLGRSISRWRIDNGFSPLAGFRQTDVIFASTPPPWTVMATPLGRGQASVGGEVLTVSGNERAVQVSFDSPPPGDAKYVLPPTGESAIVEPLTTAGPVIVDGSGRYQQTLRPEVGSSLNQSPFGTSLVVNQQRLLATGALIIPVAALTTRSDGALEVQCKRGAQPEADSCGVTIGATDGLDVVIASGLELGDQVLVPR